MDDLTNKINLNEMINQTINEQTKTRTETINKNIIECYVDAYYELDMEEKDGEILIYTNEEGYSFDSYETAVEYFKEDILSDIEFDGLLNREKYYNFYLSKEQLTFMGLGDVYEKYTQGMIEGIDEHQEELLAMVEEDEKRALETSVPSHEELAQRYSEGVNTPQERESFVQDMVNRIIEDDLEKSMKTSPEETAKNILEKLKNEPKKEEQSVDSKPKTNEKNNNKAKEQSKTNENQTKKMGKHQRYNMIAKAIDQQLNIADVARELGFSLERNGKTSFKTRQHDSLVLDLKTNKYHWNSQGITSKGVVDFWMRFKEVDFNEAIKDLSSRVDLDESLKVDYTKSSSKKPKEFSSMERMKKLVHQLQENNFTFDKTKMTNTIAYLCKTRKIDIDIVKKMIDDKLLAQTSDKYGTYATFLGKDENGHICSICKRTNNPNSKFRGDYSGCNYERGWFFDPQFNMDNILYYENQMPNPDKKLLVFESSIEAMSYMTILKLTNIDYTQYAYLSCGSISKDKSVLETCKLYGYNDAVIMFNNDFDKENNPGKTRAIEVASVLKENGIKATVLVPEGCNDWNDKLNLYKENKITLSYSRDKANNNQKKSPKQMLQNLKDRPTNFSQEKVREKSLER